jgi:hypothetical protein
MIAKIIIPTIIIQRFTSIDFAVDSWAVFISPFTSAIEKLILSQLD